MSPSIGPFLNGRQLCLPATQSEPSSRRFAVYFSIGQKSMQGGANWCSEVGIGPRGYEVVTIEIQRQFLVVSVHEGAQVSVASAS
jgi:hypothetical protein